MRTNNIRLRCVAPPLLYIPMQTILVLLVLLSASPAYVLSYYAGLRSMPFKRSILLPSSSSTSLFAKKTFKVTVVHDGLEKVIDVKEGEPILMAALDAGIDLPHDCDMGVCLTCPSRIVSGEVDQTGGTLDQSVIDQVIHRIYSQSIILFITYSTCTSTKRDLRSRVVLTRSLM